MWGRGSDSSFKPSGVVEKRNNAWNRRAARFFADAVEDKNWIANFGHLSLRVVYAWAAWIRSFDLCSVRGLTKVGRTWSSESDPIMGFVDMQVKGVRSRPGNKSSSSSRCSARINTKIQCPRHQPQLGLPREKALKQ